VTLAVLEKHGTQSFFTKIKKRGITHSVDIAKAKMRLLKKG